MNRPNIIYMHSHDTGRFISPHGYAVPTPQLQAFAEGGTLFRQNFCIQPCCSASRAALLTGCYPHENGMLGLAHRGWSLYDYRQHIIHTLHDVGYTSALSGVQHVADFKKGNPHNIIGYEEKLEFDNKAGEDADDAACRYLAREHDKPFFLAVGFGATHRPFKKATPADDPRYIAPPPFLPDTPENRQDMADYHASVRYLDERMGNVVQAVADNGLADNTLIIITTDHGIPFPYAKCHLTDHGLGVMLMLQGPGIPAGACIDQLVTHMDLFPSICELLEIDKPDWLRGKSLLPLLRGECEMLHDYVFGEMTFHASYEPMRSVRNTRYKLIKRFNKDWLRAPLANCDAGYSKTTWVEHGWADLRYHEVELYDLIFDPAERQNLADDPAYQQIRDELLARLDQEMRETGDPLRDGPVEPPGGARLNRLESINPQDKDLITVP